MLLIKCPWCGNRDESEFSYGGEAGIKRPLQPTELNDEQWADYLFMRKNSKGKFLEQWNHSLGCRQWFLVQRDTVTYKILDSYQFDQATPKDKDSD